MTERMLCILNFGLAMFCSNAQTIRNLPLASGIVTSDQARWTPCHENYCDM